MSLDFGQGLIIGRTTAYLVDPENADIAAKKRIAGTQSHEVAHMWCVIISRWAVLDLIVWFRFGNITTMEWWDNLYLNEGSPGPVFIISTYPDRFITRVCNSGTFNC